MRENIEIARSRGFSDILSDTFGLFRQNFKPLTKCCLVICGLFVITNIIISSMVDGNHQDTSLATPIGLFQLVISFVNYGLMLCTVQSYFALYKEKGNHPPSLLEVWGYVKYYFFRVFWTNILLLVLTAVGTFLCLLPGIYLAVVFSLVAPIMVIENGNMQYSFNKAFRIIKGNWWFSFGSLLVIGLIAAAAIFVLLIPAIVISSLGAMATGKSTEILMTILFAIIFALSQMLTVLPLTSSTLLYYAFTEEKEGTSLLEKINSFGKKDSAADQLSSEQY